LLEIVTKKEKCIGKEGRKWKEGKKGWRGKDKRCLKIVFIDSPFYKTLVFPPPPCFIVFQHVINYTNIHPTKNITNMTKKT
jgi:hypothetical protein